MTRYTRPMSRLQVTNHRQHDLPENLNTFRIVIVAKEVSDTTYTQVEYGKKSSELGYVPFTRVVLDYLDILVSARPKIQAERN